MDKQELTLIAALIKGTRWAALGSLRAGAPFVSWVAFAPEQAFQGFLLHLSRLSPHTQNLLADPRATLAISEPEAGADDPQTLARISIQGRVSLVDTADPGYPLARELYLRRLPAAEQLFSFPDFLLFRLMPEEARYIGGFARAYTLTPELLGRAAVAG